MAFYGDIERYVNPTLVFVLHKVGKWNGAFGKVSTHAVHDTDMAELVEYFQADQDTHLVVTAGV